MNNSGFRWRLTAAAASALFLSFPFPAFPQIVSPSHEQMVSATLDLLEQRSVQDEASNRQALNAVQPSENDFSMPQTGWQGYSAAEEVYEGRREEEMETTLRKFEIELALELFITQGEQKYTLLDQNGDRAFREKFENQGKIPVMKGEISAGRFALGGRYGNNILDKSRRCTDEYWDVFMNFNGVPQDVDYVIGTESSRGRIQFFDANLYYTVWGPVKTGEASRKLWPADRLSLDVFGGYQWYHGRYVMVDPVWGRKALANGSWWTQTVPELPAEEGLYYPYAVTYRGPRAGVRANGTAGRFSSSLSLAFAYLETEASGYWANYSFRQKGSGGYGIDAGLEATYAITPSWSFGLGYNFIGLYQKRMKETDTFPDPFNPGSFIDVEAGNVVRDTENTTYGFVFILKYIW